MIAVWRGAAALLRRPRTAEGLLEPFSISSENWLTASLVLVVMLVSVGLGLFPQVIAPIAASLAEGYTFFLP